MSRIRMLAAVGVAATLVGASALTPAHAEVVGVGTASAGATLVHVNLLGDTLGVDLVVDTSSSNTDSNAGASQATTSLLPARIGSTKAAALNWVSPSFEVRSTGTADQTQTESFSFPAEVSAAAQGTINPSELVAVVDGDGARSSLSNSLVNVALGGAVATVDSLANQVTTNAGTADSTVIRSISLDTLAVLKLGALMSGLGISTASLPTDAILGLLQSLNFPLPGYGTPAEVSALVAGLESGITQVQGIIDAGSGTVSSDVLDLLGGLGVVLEAAVDPAAALAALQAQLAGVLSTALTTLDEATVIGLKDVTASVSAIAADTVGRSSADVTAAIGEIVVGGNVIPGVDLLATASQIESAVAQVEGAVAGVLANVPGVPALPGLSDLVDLKLFDKTKSVVADGSYVRSAANLVLAGITITPPVGLTDVVAALDPANGIGEQITALGGTVPVVGDALGGLVTATSDTTPLSDGARVQVLSMSASSNFRVVSGSSDDPTLAATGGSTGTWMLIGALMAAGALGIRRRLRFEA